MDLYQAINAFYYHMSLNELRKMNQNKLYPNITYNSLLYLDLISYKENCTASQLAEALHISKSAVTIKVNELIKMGLVEKTQSQTDKRIFYLSVKPAVREDYRLYDACCKRAVDILKERYTKQETDAFIEMLGVIQNCYLAGHQNE